MSKNNNIEEQFKNAFEHFEADVNPQVWTSIEQGLPSVSAPAVDASSLVKGVVGSSKLSVFTIGIAAAVLTGIVAVSYFAMNATKPEAIVITSLSAEKTMVAPATIENQSVIAVNKNTSIPNKKAKIENEPLVSSQQELKPAASNNATAVFNNNAVATQPVDVNNIETASNTNTQDKNNPNPVPSISSADEKHENISSPAIDVVNTATSKTNTNESFNWGVIPNAFSPNADGKNDVFKITNSNIETIKVTIIDCNGKQVHEWTGINGFWDGKDVNGNDLPKGVYYYFIFATSLNGEALKTKGSITLLR